MVAAGQVVKRYQLLEQVHVKGPVRMFRAAREQEDVVLIAVIPPEVANEPIFIRAFEREAEVLAHLEHPHIVPLSDYWRDPSGAYVVTAHDPRRNIGLVLGKPWSHDLIARFVDQCGSALSYAHSRGVIHGDVRPANIVVDERLIFCLTGFAISHLLSSDPASVLAWKGSDYVSPEEFWGKPVTEQSDIYALAILIYEMLTGEVLHGRHVYDSLPQVRSEHAGIALAIDGILQRATTREPDAGYHNVLDMITDLQRALLGKPGMPLTVPLANPYPGPRSFLEADIGTFFGREVLTNLLLRRVAEPDAARFLALVGPSGSGKSSVVRAGLIPALRQGALPGSDEWFITTIVPSHHPFDEVEIALNKLAGNTTVDVRRQLQQDARGLIRAARTILPEQAQLVLVIDQFEELFTLNTEPETVQPFLDLICASATEPRSPIYVIIILRADFTDRPLLHARFGELMRQRVEFITPMSPDELRQAIMRPAERVGLQVAPALVTEITNEVCQHPGTLPMMQYALAKLFDEREGSSVLTLEAYGRIGGALGAMTRRADEVYSLLSSQQQEMAEQLFLRLVTLGEGVEDSRRRALQSELLDMGGEVMSEIMRRFVQARLLQVDRDPLTREQTIELPHEAILRRWPRLRIWLEDNRADIRTQRQLATAVAAWRDSNQDRSFLLHGAHLQQFEDWQRQTRLVLTPHERAFLQASIAERERVSQEDERRRQREQALQRTVRRFLLSIIAVLLLASLVGISLTVRIQHEAQRARALALTVSAQLAMDEGHPDLALALATYAIGMPGAVPDTQVILNEIMGAARTERLFEGHGATVRSVALSPDGRIALSGSDDDTAILWDVATGQPLTTLRGRGGNMMSVAISPDGRSALTASNRGELTLWNIARDTPGFGQVVRRFQTGSSAVLSVAITRDGQYAASGGCAELSGAECLAGEVALWEMESGQMARRFQAHTDWVWAVAFSPDGQRLVSASDDQSLIVWRPFTDDDPLTEPNEQIIRRLTGHTDGVRSVAFSPDGRRILSGSNDNNLILWNIAQDSPTFGRIIRRFEGHTDNVRSVAFSHNGQQILSASDDSTIIQWQMFTGQRIRTYQGHLNGITSVVFSRDDREALSGSIDHTLRLWSLNDEPTSEASTAWICQHRYVRSLSAHEQLKFEVFEPACNL